MATTDTSNSRIYNSKGAVDTMLYSESNRQSCRCGSKEGPAEICSLSWQDVRALRKPLSQTSRHCYSITGYADKVAAFNGTLAGGKGLGAWRTGLWLHC